MVKPLTDGSRFVNLRSVLQGKEIGQLLGHITSNPLSPTDCFSQSTLVSKEDLPTDIKPTVTAEVIEWKDFRSAAPLNAFLEDEDLYWTVVIIRKVRHFPNLFDSLYKTPTFSEELFKILKAFGTAYMVTSTYSVLHITKKKDCKLADAKLNVLVPVGAYSISPYTTPGHRRAHCKWTKYLRLVHRQADPAGEERPSQEAKSTVNKGSSQGSKFAVNKGTSPELTVDKGTSPELTVDKGTSPELTINKESSPKLTVDKGTSPELTINKGTSPELMVNKEPSQEAKSTVNKGSSQGSKSAVDKGTSQEARSIFDKGSSLESKSTIDKGTSPELTVDKGTSPGFIAETDEWNLEDFNFAESVAKTEKLFAVDIYQITPNVFQAGEYWLHREIRKIFGKPRFIRSRVPYDQQEILDGKRLTRFP